MVTAATVLAFTFGAAAQVPGAAQWPKTNFEKRNVDLGEIVSGGPPKDGIPALDAAQFVGIPKADAWLDEKEPVIAVSLGDDTKAYPLQILIWHEIVNDIVGEVPVSVTFCPLCNSCIAFDRRVGDRILDFGTTGRLRKSDMVMYDRQTQSWWQQLIGEAIVGELTGTVLKTVPADIVSYGQFKRAFPAGKVLSRDTGYLRDYGTNPYRGYDSITDRPFLFYDKVDPRLAPMERVINVRAGPEHRIYPFSAFEGTPVINDDFNGEALVLFSRHGTHSVLDTGQISDGRFVRSVTAYSRALQGKTLTFVAVGERFVDNETGSTWDLFGRAISGPLTGQRLVSADSGVHFAFAWLAFNPNSSIYGK